MLGLVEFVEFPARKPALGLMMLTEAAMGGSEVACWRLGEMFRRTRNAHQLGLQKDEAQVAKWYRKLADCTPGATSLPLMRALRAKALEWLRRYDARSGA